MVPARDIVQRRAITHMKLFATGLLLLMVVVFALSSIWEPGYSWLQWVRAFSEAAMVGALADWFAVTALFRHPLGIPIPHTAIVPMRRDEIGKMLGNFFRDNFLSHTVIHAKVEQLNLVEGFARWLENPKNRAGMIQKLTGVFPQVSDVLRDEHIRPLIEQSVHKIIEDADFAAIAGDILDILIAGDRDKALRGEIARLGEKLIDAHQSYIRERLREELPWYIPNFVHNSVYERLLDHLHGIFIELRVSETSESSVLLRRAINELKTNLRTSPYLRERGGEVKKWLFENRLMRDYMMNLWQELGTRLSGPTASGRTVLADLIDGALGRFAHAVLTDAEMQRSLNRALMQGVLSAVKKYGEEIVTLVSETVKNWETKTLVEKIELQVGRDLQYIRLNGTIVGGLAGILIHLVVVMTGL